MHPDLHDNPGTHASGAKRRMEMKLAVRGFAKFYGDDSAHRIVLERHMAAHVDDSTPYALWVGMNPSDAAGDCDDLTVHKEQVWTKRLGFERYVKMNWGTYRATQPDDLSIAGRTICHEAINLQILLRLARDAGRVILACGDPPQVLMPFARRQLAALMATNVDLWCLDVVKSGWPRHSSRIGYDAPAGRTERFIPFVQLPE